MIDRIAPTLRPDRTVRGYQQWRSLLFLHWPVPIDLLRAVVPPSLEIDTWNGGAYVGVVPFAGCCIIGFAHESAMSPYRKQPPELWPGLLSNVPEQLRGSCGPLRQTPPTATVRIPATGLARRSVS